MDPELIYDSSTFRDREISRFQINFQNIDEDDYDYTITWSLTGEVTEDFTFVNRNFFEYNWIRSGTYNLYYDIAIPLMNTEYSNLLSPVVILESTFYFSIPGKVKKLKILKITVRNNYSSRYNGSHSKNPDTETPLVAKNE